MTETEVASTSNQSDAHVMKGWVEHDNPGAQVSIRDTGYDYKILLRKDE